ncbi:MAG: hypothetical protein AAGI91_01895 [Bacteroidota bacterium]
MPRALAPSLVLLAALALSGCADSVEPTTDAGRPYTVYGVLDPTTETQALRVIAFAPDLNPQAPGPLGAEVVSTNLQTGEQRVWSDSVVTFEGGGSGNVYNSGAFRPLYGDSYRVEARRDDGAVTSAVVTIPPFVEPLPFAPERTVSQVVLSALWPAAPRVNEAQAVFVMDDDDCNRIVQAVPTSLPATPFEFGWTVSTDFLTDAPLVKDLLGPRNNVALVSVLLRAVVASEDWVPLGGAFDPEVLVDPNALTNVEGGFGFVGGGYVAEAEVTPDVTTIIQAGYRPGGSCP